MGLYTPEQKKKLIKTAMEAGLTEKEAMGLVEDFEKDQTVAATRALKKALDEALTTEKLKIKG